MHERTERGLTRFLFVVCCALPTALVVVFVLVSWTSWYERACSSAIEQHLDQQTGLATSIDGYEVLSPTTTRLHNVQMFDPETGMWVVKIREVDWFDSDGERRIHLHQPELQAKSLDRAWNLIHDRFLCRPEHVDQICQLVASELTIHSKIGTTLPLRNIDVTVTPGALLGIHDSARSASMQIEGQIADSLDSPPIQINIQRIHRSGGSPRTKWTLDTAGTSLPCSAIAEFCPGQWSQLGSQAKFSGVASGQETDTGWNLDLSGSAFADVALDRLFEKQNHRLSGLANIKLQRCRLERNPDKPVVDISGSVDASEGLVGRSLLAAVNEHLHFRLWLPPGNEDIPYEKLKLQFNIIGNIMRLDGLCHQEPNYRGAAKGLALGLNGLALAQTPSMSLPSTRLLSVLAPRSSEPITVTEQNRHLLNFILLPPKHAVPAANLPVQSPLIQSARQYENGPLIGQPY